MNDTKETKRCSGCKEHMPLVNFAVYKTGVYHYCKPCQGAKSKKWSQDNRERVNANMRAWRARDPKRTDKIHRTNLLQRYGLTLESFDEMMKKQKGLCANCETDNNGKRLDVDHCHKTGVVRGLLCRKCNIGMGHFLDNPILLRRAAKYLEDSNV